MKFKLLTLCFLAVVIGCVNNNPVVDDTTGNRFFALCFENEEQDIAPCRDFFTGQTIFVAIKETDQGASVDSVEWVNINEKGESKIYPGLATGQLRYDKSGTYYPEAFITLATGEVHKIDLIINITDHQSKYYPPPSAPWKGEQVYKSEIPSGFSSTVPYVHIAHNDQNGTTSKVEIKSFKLYIVVNNVAELLYEDDYLGFNPEADGGLFLLNPWCGDDIKETPMPVIVDNGTMSLIPSDRKDRIWHWWSKNRIQIPSVYQQCYIEAEVRITGGACFGVGLDWYKDQYCKPELNVNHYAAGMSKWYYSDNSNWRTIIFQIK